MKFMKAFKPSELQKHMFLTYLHLRIGAAIIAIMFPLLLWFGGMWQGIPLQDSMSAYYHAADGLMRNYFVGIMFAVGIILYLYKGYSRLENLVLSVAGVLAIGIAVFPMNWECGMQCQTFPLHSICAVLFFACISYVCIWRASDTLQEMDNEKKENRYKQIYKITGIVMMVTMGIAVVLSLIGVSGPAVFFIEAAGVWTFAVYWLIKSKEISITNAEQLAIQKKLKYKGRVEELVDSQV